MNDQINTNATVTPEVEATPSSKYIDWLLKNSIDETDSPETTYRKLAEAVWAEATRKPAKPKASELITNYTNSNSELLNRIYEARTVINNTLRKMTDGYAEELLWAGSSRPINIIGIFAPNPSFNRNRWEPKDIDVTSKIQNGSLKLNDNHFIKFTYTTYSNEAKIGSIEVKYLNNDPMALAQMVRRVCRKNAETYQANRITLLNKEQDELNKKVAELQNRVALARNVKPMKGKRVPKPKYVPAGI